MSKHEPYPEMQPDQLVDIRERLSLTRVQFGRALGYSASKMNTVEQNVKRYEHGTQAIPHWIAVTARALDVGGIVDFIESYKGPDDRAEFAVRLSRYLMGWQTL